MEKVFDFNIKENIVDKDVLLNIEDKCRSNEKLSQDDIELLLGNLSYLVREKIADYVGEDVHDYLFPYKCDLAQSMVCYYLNELGIKNNAVNINEVISGVIGHSITLASFDDKLYLIDPTYIQFFDKKNCDESKYVVINDTVCISPDPGYFVSKDNNKELVMPVLENGYVEFSEDIAKAYGDSFYKTKQGTKYSQVNNNVTSGSNYIKWFKSYTSKLSKSVEELDEMGLSIKASGNIKNK